MDNSHPAFPQQVIVDPNGGGVNVARNYDYQARGMSLRDYFAGQALIGILAAGDTNRIESDKLMLLYSLAAYQLADAMLRQREL